MAKQKKRKDGYYKRTFTFKGKKHYVYARTQAELDDKVAEKKAELTAGAEKRDNPTMRDYYDLWQAAREKTVSSNTIRTQNHYFSKVEAMIIPSLGIKFGIMKIKDVKVDDVRFIQDELSRERMTRTVNDYMALLHHIYSDACKERLIEYNPCILIKRLKRTEEAARTTYHRALSVEETKLFFDNAKESYYYNVYRIAIFTGMRIGEIGALLYSDIRGGFINVERTITRSVDGGHIIGKDAKTSAGKRRIPITDSINDVLEQQRQINIMLDNGIIDIQLPIFRAPRRGLLKAGQVDRDIGEICKRVGIEPFTAHAFRDTFATRAIEGGMNPKTLQEILGHADFAITMNLYAHSMDETKTREMNELVIAI
ncbi:MAG: site-specific integrase [Lachnospiraceae bacterium]|nr:site-specific integrase [Lachnospiraceae bacterium]